MLKQQAWDEKKDDDLLTSLIQFWGIFWAWTCGYAKPLRKPGIFFFPEKDKDFNMQCIKQQVVLFVSSYVYNKM